MSNEVNKSEGPSCDCGSVDLYEEMIKQQQSSKSEQNFKMKVEMTIEPTYS
jgi:hypothetical protein